MASTASKSNKSTARSKASFASGVAQVLDMGGTQAPKRASLGYNSYSQSMRTHWSQTGRYMKSAMRQAQSKHKS